MINHNYVIEITKTEYLQFSDLREALVIFVISIKPID
jgi:hypothetical protein